jgi:hypothetical protein
MDDDALAKAIIGTIDDTLTWIPTSYHMQIAFQLNLWFAKKKLISLR